MNYENNTYKIKPLRICDGDTFVAEVDLGFNVKIFQTFRLEGVDTAELGGAQDDLARKAKEHVAYRLFNAGEVVVKVKKKEKYGRYLATVFYDKINLNQELVREGLAVVYLS